MTDTITEGEMAQDDRSKEVSAIGYSIVCNVVDDCQITFQHFIAADATDAQVNENLDRIFRLVGRQRKLLSEPKLREEITKLRGDMAQYSKDLDKVEADWQTAQDGLHAQVAQLEERAAEAHDKAYNEHVASGRQGAFKPRGSTEQTIRACAADVAKLKELIDKNVNERAVARQQLEIAIKAREGRIALVEEQLAEIEALKAQG